MGVWQGLAMESLKFHPGLLCPTLVCPAGGPSLKRPCGHFRVACLQVGRPAVIFYPFGHPTPYAYGINIHGTLELPLLNHYAASDTFDVLEDLFCNFIYSF